MTLELPEYRIEPPEETIVGYCWKEEELYGYEDGYWINSEFVRVEDAEEYLTEQYGLMQSGEVF